MCKYCESTMEKPHYIIEGILYDLYIDKDIRCLVMECSTCDYEFEVGINYCPMCGKRLGDE